MPHSIKWTIGPVSRLDAEHHLAIRLDPREIRQGLLAAKQSLEISFPSGSTFGLFTTEWTNAPPGFQGLPEDWGHEIDSGRRWYRVGFHQVIADMPQWDKQSAIELSVTAHQSGAWSDSGQGTQFTFDAIRIRPRSDGELCISAPKPAGFWPRLCERLLSQLNKDAHAVKGDRFPQIDDADQPVTDQEKCTVRFYFRSTRDVRFQTLRVTYCRSLLYRCLTSKKAIPVVGGLLYFLAGGALFAYQIVSWAL